VAKEVHGPGWLRSLLLADTEASRSIYFAGLVFATTLIFLMLRIARRQIVQSGLSRFLTGLLAFCAGIQMLLLPVNYGILIADKTIPRVAAVGDEDTSGGTSSAWLVWEGKEGVTFLVRKKKNDSMARSLITLPRTEVRKIAITGYDPILRILFLEKRTPAGSGLEKGK
jgi:hypothetical protein